MTRAQIIELNALAREAEGMGPAGRAMAARLRALVASALRDLDEAVAQCHAVLGTIPSAKARAGFIDHSVPPGDR